MIKGLQILTIIMCMNNIENTFLGRWIGNINIYAALTKNV